MIVDEMFGTDEGQTLGALNEVAATRREQRRDGYTREHDDTTTHHDRVELAERWLDRLRHSDEGDRADCWRVLASIGVAFLEAERRDQAEARRRSEAAVPGG